MGSAASSPKVRSTLISITRTHTKATKALTDHHCSESSDDEDDCSHIPELQPDHVIPVADNGSILISQNLGELSLKSSHCVKQTFSFFSPRLLQSEEQLLHNTMERKIFLAFLSKECWRGHLFPELRQQLYNASKCGVNGRTNSFNNIAKKVCEDEDLLDAYVNSASGKSFTSFYSPKQLAALAIACALPCFMKLRRRVVFYHENQIDSCEDDTYEKLVENIYLEDENSGDDGTFDSESQSQNCSFDSAPTYQPMAGSSVADSNNKTDSESSKEPPLDYDNDPEDILSTIIICATIQEIEKNLLSGEWMTHFSNLIDQSCVGVSVHLSTKDLPNESKIEVRSPTSVSGADATSTFSSLRGNLPVLIYSNKLFRTFENTIDAKRFGKEVLNGENIHVSMKICSHPVSKSLSDRTVSCHMHISTVMELSRAREATPAAVFTYVINVYCPLSNNTDSFRIMPSSSRKVNSEKKIALRLVDMLVLTLTQLLQTYS